MTSADSEKHWPHSVDSPRVGHEHVSLVASVNAPRVLHAPANAVAAAKGKVI